MTKTPKEGKTPKTPKNPRTPKTAKETAVAKSEVKAEEPEEATGARPKRRAASNVGNYAENEDAAPKGA